MKFKREEDKIQFEILNLSESAIRKSLELIKKSKDRKKQRNMKNQWRRNKNSLLKGLKKWHNSTQGKRFHRALGRFNSLRTEKLSEAGAYQYYYYQDEFDERNPLIPLSIDEVNDALLGLSSIETHLFLELQYYEPDSEAQQEFLDIIEYFIEDSRYLKEKLLDVFYTGTIQKEDYQMLIDIFDFFIDPKLYLYTKRQELNLSNDNIDKEFEEQLNIVESLNLSENNICDKIDKLFEN